METNLYLILPCHSDYHYFIHFLVVMKLYAKPSRLYLVRKVRLEWIVIVVSVVRHYYIINIYRRFKNRIFGTDKEFLTYSCMFEMMYLMFLF